MANSKSAKKNILVTKRNYDRNKKFRTLLKTLLKQAYKQIETVSDKTPLQIAATCRLIDKLKSKGILKKNTASRKKSRLMIAFNKASALSKK